MQLRLHFFSKLKANQQTCKENKSLTVFGVGGNQGERKILEILNLSKREEQKYPDFPCAVKGHCTVKLDGIVCCTGGCEPGNIANAYDKVYQINLNETNSKWKELVPLNGKRCIMGAAIFKGCLIVARGSNSRDILRTVEYSSDPLKIWRMASLLRQKRCGIALAVCNGSLYALGGFDGTTCLSSVERQAYFNKSWQYVAPMLITRSAFAVVSLNGCLYAIGGSTKLETKSALKTVEKHDPGLNKWTFVSEMTYKRSFHCACVCDEKIFVIGGVDDSGNVIKEIECYDPSKNEWCIIEYLQHPLDNFAVFSN